LVREISEVGAKAAASSTVWYPNAAAYCIIDNVLLALVMFDWAVMTNRDGAASGEFGWCRNNSLWKYKYI
jgi:hypothetical protein